MNVPETESEDPLCLTGTFRVQLQSTLNKEMYLANFVHSIKHDEKRHSQMIEVILCYVVHLFSQMHSIVDVSK